MDVAIGQVQKVLCSQRNIDENIPSSAGTVVSKYGTGTSVVKNIQKQPWWLERIPHCIFKDDVHCDLVEH